MSKILIPIEVSARHVHLSLADSEKLFGVGHQLQVLKDLSQPGQFAAEETVRVETEKISSLPPYNVRVLGPVRNETQLEITTTDAFYLGIVPPVRLSGDLEGSAGSVFLVGPKGKIELKKGVIVSKRHIHASEEDAKKYNLKQNQIVSIRTSGERAITFHNVSVRIDPAFQWSTHIDVDEANAAGIPRGGEGEVIL